MTDVDTDRQIVHTLFLNTQKHSPGIPAVETEGDLVHTARVSHHLVKTRLKAEGKYKQLLSREMICLKIQEKCLCLV